MVSSDFRKEVQRLLANFKAFTALVEDFKQHLEAYEEFVSLNPIDFNKISGEIGEEKSLIGKRFHLAKIKILKRKIFEDLSKTSFWSKNKTLYRVELLKELNAIRGKIMVKGAAIDENIENITRKHFPHFRRLTENVRNAVYGIGEYVRFIVSKVSDEKVKSNGALSSVSSAYSDISSLTDSVNVEALKREENDFRRIHSAFGTLKDVVADSFSAVRYRPAARGFVGLLAAVAFAGTLAVTPPSYAGEKKKCY